MQEKASKSVLVAPLSVSVGVQTFPTPFPNNISEPLLSHISELSHANLPSANSLSEDFIPTVPPLQPSQSLTQPSLRDNNAAPSYEVYTTHPASAADRDSDMIVDRSSSSDSGGRSLQRSLSPMDLESAPSSPTYSPQLLVTDIPARDSAGQEHPPDGSDNANESQLAAERGPPSPPPLSERCQVLIYC